MWRLPYYEDSMHKEFRTFIYSFTWVRVQLQTLSFFFSRMEVQEDPFEDMKYLELTKDDSVFVITSAGDNALHYAIGRNPRE